MSRIMSLLCLCHFTVLLLAQNKLDFKGQASLVGNYSPDNTYDMFVGARYIPELNYQFKIDTTTFLDCDLAANAYANSSFQPFYKSISDVEVDPYRAWVRFSKKNYEIRGGLQKIDFGSATLLRPLQWFNQIDPRDPLSLTNGVYGLLGRYYFKNNANIWLWGLFGNEKTRGFDAAKTFGKDPEYGGRVQLPVPRGEIAFSYHHRTADLSDYFTAESYEQIPENRYGFDIKLDVKVGLWLEASHIHKNVDVGVFTHQTLLNIGSDYTFGIGNGLNVVVEHLLTSNNEEVFEFKNNENVTATSLTYPIGLFNNLSMMTYYSWDQDDLTYFLNFEHQFNKLVGYVMAFYNPTNQEGIQENELVNTFAGPGFRLMLVYNH